MNVDICECLGGAGLPGEKNSWDLGEGAGFYLNATVEPWNKHYHMYDYVTQELPALVEANLPITSEKAISGHSMGGHGALIIYLKNPGKYKVSYRTLGTCTRYNDSDQLDLMIWHSPL